MQVGCGFYELRVRDRPYLYFWHYELRNGRSVQVKEYVGPAASLPSRDETARRCEAYYRRMAEQLDRLRIEVVSRLAVRG